LRHFKAAPGKWFKHPDLALFGQWWEDQPWQEDAWDLEIVFSGESPARHGWYRFCYDRLQEKWLVLGVYD